MRSKNLISSLALAALAASALALSHPVQAHERAYSAPRVIQVGRRHHDDRGGHCGSRHRYQGKRHHGGHGYRHDHHEYYRHHRQRAHDDYRHGGHRYRDRDHGSIRFRIDYREIL